MQSRTQLGRCPVILLIRVVHRVPLAVDVSLYSLPLQLKQRGIALSSELAEVHPLLIHRRSRHSVLYRSHLDRPAFTGQRRSHRDSRRTCVLVRSMRRFRERPREGRIAYTGCGRADRAEVLAHSVREADRVR